MTFVIILRPRASAELIEAFEWYEIQKPGLGHDLKAEFNKCVARIAENPELFQRVSRRVRRARLKRFPYAIFFHASHKEIVIHSLFHGRRNPKIWMRRIRGY